MTISLPSSKPPKRKSETEGKKEHRSRQKLSFGADELKRAQANLNDHENDSPQFSSQIARQPLNRLNYRTRYMIQNQINQVSRTISIAVTH